MEISYEIPQPKIPKISLKIAYLKFHSNLPGNNVLIALNSWYFHISRYAFTSKLRFPDFIWCITFSDTKKKILCCHETHHNKHSKHYFIWWVTLKSTKYVILRRWCNSMVAGRCGCHPKNGTYVYGRTNRLRQAIICPNAGILLIGPLGTNFSEISNEIHIFSFKKMHLKLASGNWQPSCLGLNVLKPSQMSQPYVNAIYATQLQMLPVAPFTNTD